MQNKTYCPNGRHLYDGAGACTLCGTIMAEAPAPPQDSTSKSSDLLSIVLGRGTTVKITPAMVKWCREVKGGARIVKANVVTYFGPRGFTYVMGMKMEAAGLLEFKRREPAVLTDAGERCCVA